LSYNKTSGNTEEAMCDGGSACLWLQHIFSSVLFPCQKTAGRDKQQHILWKVEKNSINIYMLQQVMKSKQ
jgi:hypothetical protein